MKMQVRQGDVLLVKVRKSAATLAAATSVRPENGRVILARGEVSGHTHSLDATLAQLFGERDGRLYLRVDRAAELEHEEHAAIRLTRGVYAVVRQREYAPGRIVNAAD